MGNKQQLQIEISRKQVKDSIVLQSLQATDFSSVLAPRAPGEWDLQPDDGDCSLGLPEKRSISIDLSGNSLSRAIGRHPSISVLQKTNDSQCKEAEPHGKVAHSSIKRLLEVTEKKQEDLKASGELEEFPINSPVSRYRGGKLRVPRSVSVTKLIPAQTHTMKLIRPKARAAIVRRTEPHETRSLSDFLKTAVKMKVAHESYKYSRPVAVQRMKMHMRTPSSPRPKRPILSFSDEVALVSMAKKEEKVFLNHYKLRKSIVDITASMSLNQMKSLKIQGKAEVGLKWIGKNSRQNSEPRNLEEGIGERERRGSNTVEF